MSDIVNKKKVGPDFYRDRCGESALTPRTYQTNMINSHKILQPYLTIVDQVDMMPEEIEPDEIYDRPTRDKVRSAAQLLLAELGVNENE